MLQSLAVNGRFAGRPLTGVDRVAFELTKALRELIASLGLQQPAMETLLPPSLAPQAEVFAALGLPAPQPVGRFDGHAWEQLDLSLARPSAWLLSLCNTGPVMRRKQAVIIHDAQFAEYPSSYSRAFRAWYNILCRLLGRRAAVVFTVSYASRDALERFGIVPRGKIHVLRSGVDHVQGLATDLSILDRNGIAPGRYFLAIGSLAPHKNLGTLVRAFIEADPAGIPLVIAGGGNARVFGEAGLPEAANVRYLGRVTDPELKALYENALAFATPSLSEGFGLPPLEAMSVGCPVIATTGGAIPEICGDVPIYVDPLDQDAWTRAVRKLATDGDLRARMSGQGLARASEFRWRDTALQVLRALAQHDGDKAVLQALDQLAETGDSCC